MSTVCDARYTRACGENASIAQRLPSARTSAAMYSTSAPISHRTTASPIATSTGLAILFNVEGATAISIGSIAVDPCAARVSRPSALDHQRSVVTERPSLSANCAAGTPLRRHRVTVFCHHALDRRLRSTRPIPEPNQPLAQVRAPQDGYLAVFVVE